MGTLGGDGGGSGFEKLVQNMITGVLQAEIVAVVSNHANGGVREKANRLGILFINFSGPYTAETYQRIVRQTGAEWVALSGWLKLTAGLDPTKTFNIHPGPLPKFGGPKMYGHHVHEAVLAAYQRGEVTRSAVCMHFVTPKYDEGPVFFRRELVIQPTDTAETLAARVNTQEHEWQARITNMVVWGEIRWDGCLGHKVRVSSYYARLINCCPKELQRM